MKKLSTLLLISLLNIPSFAYAMENSSIKEKDEKIETKTSSTKDTSNMYIKIGINRPKITYNFGNLIKSDTFRTFSFNASLGLDINDKFSTEITAKWFKDIIDTKQTGTITKKTLSNTLLLTDGYFYIPTGLDEYKPYLSTGIGIAAISSKATTANGSLPPTTTKNSNISFAYSMGIGFNTPMWDSVSFDMNFKYYNLGKLRSEDTLIEANSFSMGIKIAI